MAKTIVVMGFGAGISASVAARFGLAGFSVALVGRNPERLAAGVAALQAKGIAAAGFQADASDTAAIEEMLGRVRAMFGPITVLHWNAFGGEARDLITTPVDRLRGNFDVAVFGLLAAVQGVLPDLRSAGGCGAILVSNGSAGEIMGRWIDSSPETTRWGFS